MMHEGSNGIQPRSLSSGPSKVQAKNSQGQDDEFAVDRNHQRNIGVSDEL